MHSVKEIADCLLNGGVALLPTDTVYGLAALASNAEAVARIFKLKQRPQTHNLPIMVASQSQLLDIGMQPNPTIKSILASDLVPGDLTLIVGLNLESKKAWLADREEIAFRIPNHQLMLEVLALTGPLAVSSANKHGSDTASTDPETIISELDGKPDIYLSGNLGAKPASTILNCRIDPPKIERQGDVSWQDINSVMSK